MSFIGAVFGFSIFALESQYLLAPFKLLIYIDY